jgi:hypothetical protein
LGAATWPLPDARACCELHFPTPLRLLRRGKLIAQPTLADLIVFVCRRVKSFLHAEYHAAWDDLARVALDLARRTPTQPWRGVPRNLLRYSARQGNEIELRGVSGVLGLPFGPGKLWPLLAAAQWIHVGKGAVLGMGQLVPQPC